MAPKGCEFSLECSGNGTKSHIAASQSLFFLPSTLTQPDRPVHCPALTAKSMPIRPQPLTLNCSQCHWRTTWQPSSDALTHMPPSSCPQCGSEDLQVQQKTGLLADLADLAAKVRRVIAG